jgi:hypothetical protein
MNDLLPGIEYYPIYWKDGMHVSSQEFFASDRAMHDWVRDARALALNEYNYGLLPSNHEEPDNYPHFYCSNNKQHCNIQVKACRAVTAGGGRIEITPEGLKHGLPLNSPSTNINLATDARYDLYITVLPFKQLEEAGTEIRDTPPGRRFATLSYALSSNGNSERQVSTIQGAHSLKVGEVIVENGVGIIDSTYIPPCTQMSSHPALFREYKIIEEVLQTVLDSGRKAIQKYRPDRNNVLSGDISFFAEKFVFFLASSLPAFKLAAPRQPPLYTIAYVSNLMQLVETALSCVDYEKNIMKTFPDVRNLQDLSRNWLNADEINHANIKPTLTKIKEYLKTFVNVLGSITSEGGRNSRGGRL